MDYPKLKVEGYGLQPQEYFWRGEEMLKQAIENQNPHFLFYAAFEFRCCLEQTLKVYLELINPDSWSKTMAKLYRTKRIKKKILSREPEFYKKVEFVDICIRSMGLKGVHSLDLDAADKHYGMIGDFMHAQVRPDDTVENPEWWGRFVAVLRHTRDYLFDILSHDMGFIDLNEGGWELYEKWKAGDLTEEEVMDEFRQGLQQQGSV